VSRQSRDAPETLVFWRSRSPPPRGLQEVGERIGRSKAASLSSLERKLGPLRLPELSRERLIQFGKELAREGAGPVTLAIDLGYIKTILSHAAAVHGVILSMEPVVLARIALARLGLVGKGEERDRRPTQDELHRLIAAFEANPRQQIPLGRIVRFAVATAMRQEEICRIEWADFDPENKMLLVRDRKDPRKKMETISAFRSSTFAAMLKTPDGDREMVEVLALVLQHDEQAVLGAVELALEAGAPTKTHILNLLHRLVDGKPMDTPPIKAPQALTLTTEPQANVERYDALRKAREARHAS
jgi:hypothetical protein